MADSGHIELTPPDTHKALPTPAGPVPSIPSKTKNADKKARAKKAADSKLKQKNRKHHTISITTLFDLTVEAGNNYKLSGFSPDIDDGVWTVGEVTHSLTGKSASTTRIHFYRRPEVS
jgi:phage protein D